MGKHGVSHWKVDRRCLYREHETRVWNYLECFSYGLSSKTASRSEADKQVTDSKALGFEGLGTSASF